MTHLRVLISVQVPWDWVDHGAFGMLRSPGDSEPCPSGLERVERVNTAWLRLEKER